jgi:hypothetical protein
MMNKKQTNKKRQALQMLPPQAQHKGVVELADADLEQVQGGTTNLMDACSKGKHVPTVTIAV